MCPGSRLFSFSCSFGGEKLAKTIGWQPCLCGWRPLLGEASVMKPVRLRLRRLHSAVNSAANVERRTLYRIEFRKQALAYISGSSTAPST